MLSLLALVGLLAPPPTWTALSAPGLANIRSVTWSPDGKRIGVCAEDAAVVFEPATAAARVVGPGCEGFAFAPDAIYLASRYPEPPHTGLLRITDRVTPLPVERAWDVLWRDGRLLAATGDGLEVWQGDRRQATVPIKDLRRLEPLAEGVLGVGRTDVVIFGSDLAIRQRLRLDPAPSVNGLYDARPVVGGYVAVDNEGSLWRWDAAGKGIAYHLRAVAARRLEWTGQHLVANDSWIDPARLEVVARDPRLPRADGPLAISPDTTTIAHPVHGGLILRPALPPRAVVRGVPAGGRGLLVGAREVLVGDESGALVRFDRTGRALGIEYVARDGLRELVGDPAGTVYALTEWGDVVVRRAGQPVRRWPAQSGERLHLSADGKVLLVGGQRRAYRFETATGTRTELANTGAVHHTFDLTFAPDGGVLLFGDELPTRWFKAAGQPSPDLFKARHGGFDRRGRLWVEARRGSGVRAWPSGRLVHPVADLNGERILPLKDGGVLATGWSGDLTRYDAQGKTRWRTHAPWHVGGADWLGADLLTTGPDLTVSRWDVARGRRSAWAPPGRGAAIDGLVFSADGRHLAVAHDASGVRLWDTRTHSLAAGLPLPEVGDVVISRDADRWVVRTGHQTRTWTGKGSATRPVELPEDVEAWVPREADQRGRFLFMPTAPQGAVVDLVKNTVGWRPTIPDAIRAARISADGQRVALLGGPRGDRLTIQARGKPPREGPKGVWLSLAWQGDRLWVAGERRLIAWQGGRIVVDVATPWAPEGPAVSPRRIAVSNGRIALVYAGDRLIATLPLERGGASALVLSPDGRTLAVGGRFGGSVVLWDVDARRAIARYEAFDDGLWRATTATGAVTTGKTFARRWR